MKNRILIFLFIALTLSSHCILLPSEDKKNGIEIILLGLGGGSLGNSDRLKPGATIDLNNDGVSEGVLADSNGDGVSDGINLNGNDFPSLILLDTNGDGIPDAVDQNGDGIADYYLSVNDLGVVTITTGANGSGNTVVLVDTNHDGVPDGFDTDGDGTANDTTINQILTDVSNPTLNLSPNTAASSSTINVTILCQDPVAPGTILYTLDGSTPSFSPKTGTATNPPSKSLSLSGDGIYTLKAICRDLAGNLSAITTGTYTIDSTAPSVAVSLSASYISNAAGAIASSTATWSSNKTGTYNIKEGSSSCNNGTEVYNGTVTSGVNKTFIRNAGTHFSSEGTKEYRICVTTPGFTGFQTFQLTRDDTAPAVTPSPGQGDFSTTTSVTLVCSDSGGSGCTKIVYALQSGSAPTNPAIGGVTGIISSGTEYSTAVSLSDTNSNYLKYIARDSAGNVSSVTSGLYRVDTTVANITINANTTYLNGTDTASISWQSSKAGTYQIRVGGSNCSTGIALTNGSGNANVTGAVSAGGPDTISTIGNSNFSSGSNTIRICVANLISNFGSNSVSLTKDSTAPSVSISSPTNSGPHVTGTTVTLSCSDSGGTGCKKTAYSTSGTDPSFTDGAACTISSGTEYTAPATLPNGSYTLKARSCDQAGNVSSVSSLAIVVGPPGTPTISSATASNTQISIAFSAVANATSYKVYYGTSSGVTTSNSSVSGTSSPIVVNGLVNETIYFFRLTAISSAGESSLSTEVNKTPTTLPILEYCAIQHPPSLTVAAGGTTEVIYGRVYHAGVTPASGADPRVIASVGYGPDNTNPMTHPHLWVYTTPTYNIQIGNDDEYQAAITAPTTPGTYRYVYRFSINGIATATYCDKDGNGSNAGMSFSEAQLGTMTVN
ncbi:FN3 associated domain-containing protein [Leptospira brenneri]|uniref:FN3 associated domain-containing protein n=1 Tax=Leptospira brenneri TaxID=2023182 RepID=UPI000C2A5D33|nr:chitobiase/beta-hexosaminidase C-terminal domain-containing protein [Leptospira brenneri]PJZ44532.1 chitobiase/beta-hexosaminidase [Leptospira brenneri]